MAKSRLLTAKRLFPFALLIGLFAPSLPAQSSEKLEKLAPGENPSIAKLSGPLLQARSLVRQGLSLEELRLALPTVRVKDDLLEIEVRFKELHLALVERLREIGVVVVKAHYEYARVDALADPELLDEIAEIAEVSTIHPNYGARLAVGAVTSQADSSIRADQARATFFPINGTGVRVGVLSDSFNDVIGGSVSGSGCNRVLTGSSSQGSGDLPASVFLLDNGPGGGTDEGSGMAELISDLAPGSDIMFHTAFNSLADFAAGITELVTCGANVIVDDVLYFAEPMFQDGIIAQAAQQAVDAGVPYFSSAGNDGVGGVRETYVDANPASDDMAIPPSGDDLHAFPGADDFALFTLPAGSCQVRAVLQWNEPFSGGLGPGSAVDLDIYYCTSPAIGSCPISSAGIQGCSPGARSGDPLEILIVNSSGPSPRNRYLAVEHYCGSETNLDFRIAFSVSCAGTTFEAGIFDQPQIYGHSAAAGAAAVGAVFYGEIDSGGTVDPPSGQIDVEPFSSFGGNLPFYFDGSGNPLAGAPVNRFKPEIAAPDGTNTTFFGNDIGFDPDAFPNFFGTSAAAPHAAAVAALMLEARSTLTPSEVVGTLRSTAVDIETPGQDDFSGDGLIDALNALNALDQMSPIAIDMIEFSARRSEDGVRLEWETGYEIDNVGFHIYRQDAYGVQRLTAGPVAGSALLSGTALTEGHAYSWVDPSAPPSGAEYWMEQIDLDGNRSWHGPVSPRMDQPDKTRIERHQEGRLLSQVGHEFREGDPPSFSITQRAAWGQSLPDDVAVQSAIAANGKAVKILVSHEGVYRLDQPELITAGLDPSSDPRRLRLFADGAEVAIGVSGESDGRLDPEDSVFFYGFGQDTPWSDSRTFWLFEDAGAGIRWSSSTSSAGPTAQSFLDTLEWKPRTTYFEGLKNGQNGNFFGPVVAGDSVEQELLVSSLDSDRSGEAFFEIDLQGVLGPHQVTVILNGTILHQLIFQGREHQSFHVAIPGGILVEGANLLVLQGREGGEDVSLLDRVRLTYPRLYRAQGGQLRLTLDRGMQGLVMGFSSPDVLVLDVTDPRAARQADFRVVALPGGYAAEIGAGASDRTLWAVAATRLDSPGGLSLNLPSAWRPEREGAEAIVLTHRSLFQEVSELADFRRRQGISVALVDVQDLYDEYSFGAKDPDAIRQFLAEAHAGWATRPRFLLLAGDASFDPRGYLGFGNRDLVPALVGESRFAEAPDDNGLVDFDGNGVPDLAVGRLPVADSTQARDMIRKILDYERKPIGGHWTRNVAIVSDQQDDFNFAAEGLSLENLTPESARISRVFRDEEEAASKVQELLNRGQGLVAYLGHGSVERWAGQLLTTQTARELRNGRRLPLVLSMSCLNGRFHGERESLAEALLSSPGGGAVAVLASPTLEGASDQQPFAEALFRTLLDSEVVTLGEALQMAREFPGVPPSSSVYQLFGDPMTRPVFFTRGASLAPGWSVRP